MAEQSCPKCGLPKQPIWLCQCGGEPEGGEEESLSSGTPTPRLRPQPDAPLSEWKTWVPLLQLQHPDFRPYLTRSFNPRSVLECLSIEFNPETGTLILTGKPNLTPAEQNWVQAFFKSLEQRGVQMQNAVVGLRRNPVQVNLVVPPTYLTGYRNQLQAQLLPQQDELQSVRHNSPFSTNPFAKRPLPSRGG